MPDLYELKVTDQETGEATSYGLSSTDTGNPARLFKMFNIQLQALTNNEE